MRIARRMKHRTARHWGSGVTTGLLALTVGVASANIVMTRVAAFWEEFAGTFPCGDANGNLLPEIYGTSDHNHDSLVIYENQGGNSYREIKTGVRIRWVRDFGYGDGEGLAELINAVTIYRALNPDTFPTESVYTFNPPCGAIFTKFTDLDRDGRCEVAFGSNGVNGSGINLYENRGMDQWVHVPFPWSNAEGQFAFADFDQDGHTEIASGDCDGNLYVFKCTGDDQYARVCSTSLSPDIESYCCTAANNLEGDSVPRFIILSLNDSSMCNVRVYEVGTESLYQCVWCTQIPRGDEWYWSIGVGDVDGDRKDEFAITTGEAVMLFKNTGRHQFSQVWQYYPGGQWVRFFDLNRDGRDELIISPDSTYIFEDTSGLGAAETPKPLPWVRSIAVEPTVSRRGWPAVFTGIPDGTTVEVHDMAGRLVRTQLLKAGPSWTWNLRDQAGNLVPAGTYFAVIRNKGKATSLKLCVVK
jgi:hypothetical protein